MASKTQLRLSQLTGSMPSSSDSAAAANAIVGNDLSKVLDTLASAVKRIHGGSDFSSASAGVFAQDLVPDADGSRDLGSSSAEFAEVHANNLLSQVALAITAADGDVSVTADGSDNKVVIKGDHASGVAIHLDANEGSSSEIHMEAGVIDMDATGAATLDAGGAVSITGAGVSLAGGSAEIDLTTSGALDLNAGAVTLDGSTVSLDGTDDMNLTMTANSSSAKTMIIAAANSGSGAGVIDMDADGAISVDAGAGLSLQGGAASDLTVSSGDLSLVADGSSNKVVIKGDHASGVAIHLDANEGSSSEIHMETGVLDMDATGAATLDAGGAVSITGAGVSLAGGSGEIDLTTSGAVDINGAAITVDGSTLSLDGTDATNLTMTANSSGNLALLIDASNAGSGTAAITLGNTSGTAIAIGHSTSEVTIGDNLTVTGDLTVSGVTTTLDTTNLLVEDPIVVLNKANSSANGQGGIAIENGGSSTDMVFGRVANDTWGVGTKDTSGGAVTTLADMSLGAFRSGKLEIDGSTEHIDVSSNTMILTATQHINLDAANDIELNADGGNVVFQDGSAKKLDIKMDTSGQVRIQNGVDGDDVLFEVDAGSTEIFRLDDSASSLLMSDSKKIEFGHANHSIAGSSSSGQDLSIATGGRISVNAHIIPSSDDNSGLGVSSQRFADLFLAEGALLRMGTSAQDAFLQHSTSDRLGSDFHTSPNLENFSAFQASRIQESTITSSTTSLTFSPEIGTSISGGDVIIFQDSSGNLLGFTASSASSSATSLAVSFSSGNSTSGFTSINTSSISQTNKGQGSAEGFTDSSISASSTSITFNTAAEAAAFANTHAAGGTVIRFSDGAGNSIDATFSSYSSGASVTFSASQAEGSSAVSKSASQFSMKVVQSQKAHQIALDGTFASFNIADHDGADHGLKLAGTLVTATAAELNVMDAGTTAASVTLAGTDGFVVNDGGVMKQALISDIATFFATGRSKKSATLTAAVSAGNVATVSGMVHDFGADPDIVDVYLNGQLMLSGSSSSNGDYRINGTGPDSSLSLGGIQLNSATFSTSTTSVAFDGALASASSSFSAGKIMVMENSAGTVRFEGSVASSAGSSDTSVSLTAGTVRLFNPVTGAAVSSASSSAFAGSSAIKTADPLTSDDVVFFFGLEVDDVVTMTKNG